MGGGVDERRRCGDRRVRPCAPAVPCRGTTRRGAARVAGWLAGVTARSGASTRWQRAGENRAAAARGARAGSGAGVARGVRRHGRAKGGDTAAALELARAASGGGARRRRRDLEAMGLALEGEALVAEGEFAEGLRLLDGAAAMAIASGSDDFACVTTTCCSMLAACEVAADVERASQWCEVTTEYALRYGMRNIFAICRTSYAGVLISCGRWEEAEAELARAAREFAEIRPGMPSQATARLAELRRRQGRFAEAAELFAQVEGRRDALLGCAALALARERRRARRRARGAVPAPDPGPRPRLARARAGSARSGSRAARGAGGGRARARGAAVDRRRGSRPTRSALAPASRRERSRALEGDPLRARRHFEDAVDLFTRCGLPFEAAHARLELARALRGSGKATAARAGGAGGARDVRAAGCGARPRGRREAAWPVSTRRVRREALRSTSRD